MGTGLLARGGCSTPCDRCLPVQAQYSRQNAGFQGSRLTALLRRRRRQRRKLHPSQQLSQPPASQANQNLSEAPNDEASGCRSVPPDTLVRLRVWMVVLDSQIIKVWA